MQKPYLLLRNNQQTGPYSLEEIIQLNLKPFDLVWVEGRSAAWRYPGEIEPLKAFVPAVPQPESTFQPIATDILDQTVTNQLRTSVPFNTPSIPKTVFVSFPDRGEKISMASQKKQALAEPIRRPSFDPAPGTVQKNEDEQVQTNYSRSVHEVEEDYTNWVFRQKTRKKFPVSKKHLALALLVISISAGCYWLLTGSDVDSDSNSLHSNIGGQAKALPQEENIPAPVNEESRAVETNIVKEQVHNSTKKQAAVTPLLSHKRKIIPANQPSTSPLITEEDSRIEKQESIPDAENVATQQNQTAKTEKEKKKKVREMIRDVFSKKNKKEETAQNSPSQEEPVPANNRQTTRREESTSTNEESGTAIAEQLDLSSNAPDNWMMGVTGLKITLRNKSQSTIQKAAVTVLYYNENNQLLEKKTIYFTNVAPRGKATMAAPDHKFADHTEFRLGAVSVRDDSYAKQ